MKKILQQKNRFLVLSSSRELFSVNSKTCFRLGLVVLYGKNSSQCMDCM